MNKTNINYANKVRTKFSVSICVYKNDNPEHFKRAIESILNQTRRPDEIVLVVDGPIPETINEVIIGFEDKNFFKVIRLSENVGHGNARRIGLEHCSYELVALMDADDISVPDRFEKQITCFEQSSNLSVVGGNIVEFIDSQDNIVGIREVPQEDDDIKTYMRKRCPFNQVTVMFKKSDVVKAGGFIDWYCEEDYYLWIRMSLAGCQFRNLVDNLVYVRVGPDMYRRRGGWKYFLSEAKLQRYMLQSRIISIGIYLNNLIIRFIVQILMPNGLRAYFFKKFARIND